MDFQPGHASVVAVDIGRLVENVYIAPGTPAWLHATIQDILNKFGLDRDSPPFRVR